MLKNWISTLLALFAVIASCVAVGAAPTQINVGLHASWRCTPLELEALEWIQQETALDNVWTYIDHLGKAIHQNEFKSEKQVFEWVDAHLRSMFGDAMADVARWALTSRVHSPLVELHATLAEQVLGSVSKLDADPARPFAIVKTPQGNQQFIDSLDALTILLDDPQPSSSEPVSWSSPHADPFEFIQHEHVYVENYLDKAHNRHVVILYGQVSSQSFHDWLKVLVSAQVNGSVVFAVRHWFKPCVSGPVRLQGYRAQIALKSQEYIVVDDKKLDVSHLPLPKGFTNEFQDVSVIAGIDFNRIPATYPEVAQKLTLLKDRVKPGLFFDNDCLQDTKTIKPWDLANIGIHASMMINSAADPLLALQEVSENLPCIGSSAVNFGSPELLQEYKSHIQDIHELFKIEQHMVRSVLWIHQRRILIPSFNNVLNCATKMTSLSQLLRNLDVPDLSEALQITGQVYLVDLRFDYSDKRASVVYVNDMEKDKVYSNYAKDYKDFAQKTGNGEDYKILHGVRKNIVDAVFTFDPGEFRQLAMINHVDLLNKPSYPVRLGINLVSRPGPEGDISRLISAAFYYIVDKKSAKKGQEFLKTLVMKQQVMIGPYARYMDPASLKLFPLTTDIVNDVFEQISGRQLPEDIVAKYQDKLKASEEWAIQVGLLPDPYSNVGDNGGADDDDDDDDDDVTTSNDAIKLPVVTVNGIFARSPDTQLLQFTVSEQVRIIKNYVKGLFGDDTPAEEAKIIGVSMIKSFRVDLLDKAPKLKFEGIPPTEMKSLFKQILYINDDEISPKTTFWVCSDLNSREGIHLVSQTLEWFASLGPENFKSKRLGFLHLTDKRSMLLEYLGQYKNAVQSPSDVTPLLEKVKDLKKNRPSSDAVSEEKTQGSKITLSGKKARDLCSLKETETALIVNGRVAKAKEVRTISIIDLFNHYESLNFNRILKSVKNPAAYSSDIILVISVVLELATNSCGYLDPPFESGKDPLKESPLFSTYSGTGIKVQAIVNPTDPQGAEIAGLLGVLRDDLNAEVELYICPKIQNGALSNAVYNKIMVEGRPTFDEESGKMILKPSATFRNLNRQRTLTLQILPPRAWLIGSSYAETDMDNIILKDIDNDKFTVYAEYRLESILVEGSCFDEGKRNQPPQGLRLDLRQEGFAEVSTDTIVMSNLGYFQLKALSPGKYTLSLAPGRGSEIYQINSLVDISKVQHTPKTKKSITMYVSTLEGSVSNTLKVQKKPGKEMEPLLDPDRISFDKNKINKVHVFSVASGHLYERFLKIMMLSASKSTSVPIKFWILGNYLSANFKKMIPYFAEEHGFEFEMVTYRWPTFLREQTEKQRIIWANKILFLDVLFPLNVSRIIFVDSDQVVRGDLKELYGTDMKGHVYGYVPFCDSKEEVDGFRFWKEGFWKKHLDGQKYRISALYLVDLDRFREKSAGDQLRYMYQGLSADPGSLSNLDQDLPNYASVSTVPIFDLPQEWLWCESWCDEESKANAKTIDLCNNPMTKEPKLQSAKRIIPEWVDLDNEATESTRKAYARLSGVDYVKLNSVKQSIPTKTTQHDSEDDHDEL